MTSKDTVLQNKFERGVIFHINLLVKPKKCKALECLERAIKVKRQASADN